MEIKKIIKEFLMKNDITENQRLNSKKSEQQKNINDFSEER